MKYRRSYENGRAGKRGYTLLEMLITVVIIQTISMMVMVNIGDVEASERVDRAAQEVVVALRYARMLAMTGGQIAGVEFNTSQNQVRVWQGTGYATVSNSLLPGSSTGTANYTLNFGSKREVKGVTMPTVLLSAAPTNPYRVQYGALGSTLNNGYVTLKYGRTTKTVMIPLVGDPKIQ